MDARARAVTLGVLAGAGDALVRLFVGAPAPVATTAGVERVLLVSVVATALGLLARVAVPLYGAWRADSPSTPGRLAASVGLVAAGTAACTHLLLSAYFVDAAFLDALRIRVVGPYLVDAGATGVYAGVAALAGFLLARAR